MILIQCVITIAMKKAIAAAITAAEVIAVIKNRTFYDLKAGFEAELLSLGIQMKSRYLLC